MKSYLKLLARVYDDGEVRTDRTGIGTRSMFGEKLTFHMGEGFPLLTTKKIYWKGVLHELLWFLSGNTNIKYLQDNSVHIWDEWADGNGDLGPVYGKQWRDFGGVDQIKEAEKAIKETPDSRRIIVSAWNPGEMKDMALPPCHMLFQFYVSEGRYLDLQLYCRSTDIFLGEPYNIASYSILLHMMAKTTGLIPRKLIQVFGDLHLYENHRRQAMEQIGREPKELPELKIINKRDSVTDYVFDDFVLEGYFPHPHIKAEVAV